MLDPHVLLLSAIVFLPVLGAIVLAFIPKDAIDVHRYITLAVTLLVLLATVIGLLDPFEFGSQSRFDVAAASMQDAFNLPWIPSFNIEYFMGIDGISFPLVMLTAFICVLAMGASWSINKYVKGYCILFLLLETGMLGVFVSLDFFLFYVFWEVMLLPMYFLIGVWGGPRREYAAIKFFLYTLLGSVLMLIAILLLYFHSDLRAIARVSDYYGAEGAGVKWDDLHISNKAAAQLGQVEIGRRAKPAADAEVVDSRLVLRRNPAFGSGPLTLNLQDAGTRGEETIALYDEATATVTVFVHPKHGTAAEVAAAINENSLLGSALYAALPAGSKGEGTVALASGIALPATSRNEVHSFNLLALAAMGQHTGVFSRTIQWWSFVLLFIGFAIKVPSVPVHTWLPDAHVEAPTPISMILAGILLKMGGYGILRICYPICPFGGYDLAYVVCLIGVVSMVYGGFAAMAQKDFKRLVAYSSVSHMGYVVLGLGVWSATAGTGYNSDYWNMGVQGAMFQMIAHGISSAGMFFMVGVVYDRVHHRNLNEFGGLFGRMPAYTALSIGIFFAGLGLPGLCGFIGEVLVVLSVWKYSYVLAIISAAVVIITAGYILWTIQRVYLGAEYKGPHEEALTEINYREMLIAVPLFFFAIIFGVAPYVTVLRYMDKTIERQVDDLADWTKRVPTPLEAREREAKAPPVASAAPGAPVADAASIGSERTASIVLNKPDAGSGNE